MPGLFFSNLVNRSSIENKIDYVKNRIKSINDTHKEYFLLQLTIRLSDFEVELLSNTLNPYEKEEVLHQYNRFAKTLVTCIEHPERTPAAIKYYHMSRYYPVGIHDIEKPDFELQNVALAAAVLGLSLLATSIPVFICNPALGAGMLSAAIILIYPSCFYLMTPKSPNTIQKKGEEKEFFELAAQLIKPDLVCNEAQQDLFCVVSSGFTSW
ncbi:hypothetical protein [uncultured Legionella sp.]|uniref:hypothetical protein n=1 Tax=uncultured Legionella sp. TaxID=210934 RepID=UPI0026207022|nr:hypothetical protein [uncultured Legionella sp.]